VVPVPRRCSGAAWPGSPGERDAPGQHLVGHDRESVEVARSVRHAPAQLFGGHVGRSADDLAVRVRGAKPSRAIPKSASLAAPPRANSTFDGFTSRCKRSCRVSPSTSSSTS
jgi:hypothetical protein